MATARRAGRYDASTPTTKTARLVEAAHVDQQHVRGLESEISATTRTCRVSERIARPASRIDSAFIELTIGNRFDCSAGET